MCSRRGGCKGEWRGEDWSEEGTEGGGLETNVGMYDRIRDYGVEYLYVMALIFESVYSTRNQD